MTDKRFPIQDFPLGVPWSAAEKAYETYAKHFGTQQSLQRLAERGGFGLYEFAVLYLGKPLHFITQRADVDRADKFIGEALTEVLAAPREEPNLLDVQYTAEERQRIAALRSRTNVANTIAEQRIRQKLTQDELGRRAGTKQSRISELEGLQGNVRFDTLDRVASVLGLMVTLQAREEPKEGDAQPVIEAMRVFCGDVAERYPEMKRFPSYHKLLTLVAGYDAHPVDVPPDGPWEAKELNDENRAWGPTVWDTRESSDGYDTTAGWDRMQLSSMEQAIAVRDALNGVDRLEGEKP